MPAPYEPIKEYNGVDTRFSVVPSLQPRCVPAPFGAFSFPFRNPQKSGVLPGVPATTAATTNRSARHTANVGLVSRRHAYAHALSAPPTCPSEKISPPYMESSLLSVLPQQKTTLLLEKWKQIQVAFATAFCPWPSCHGGESLVNSRVCVCSPPPPRPTVLRALRRVSSPGARPTSALFTQSQSTHSL